MSQEREYLNGLCERVVGAVYEVSNVLGVGFLEKVYQRALLKELRLRGIRAEAEIPIPVRYKGEIIGDYYADILVESKLIIELKCVDRFADEHLAQCLNYLKATDLRLALLVNFQHPRALWKRVVNGF